MKRALCIRYKNLVNIFVFFVCIEILLGIEGHKKHIELRMDKNCLRGILHTFYNRNA